MQTRTQIAKESKCEMRYSGGMASITMKMVGKKTIVAGKSEQYFVENGQF